MKLFQLQDNFLGYLLVDVAVAAEGAGVLDVAGYLGDKVRIFHFLVEIPDQDAASHVGGGNFSDGVLFLLAGDGVRRHYDAKQYIFCQ